MTDQITPKTTMRSCPYLGTQEDPGTWISYPSSGNYCHLLKPAHSITLTYQRTVCLTPGHLQCKIYSKTWDGKIPTVIGETGIARKFISWRWLLIGFLVVAAILISVSLFTGLLVIPSQISALFNLSPSSQPTENSTGQRPSGTPTPTATQTTTEILIFSQPSPTRALATATQTPPPTATTTPAVEQIQLTPGPDMMTPFGPGGKYVLYTLQTGESVNNVAFMYQTTIEVIRASNTLIEGASVWPGTVLLILPGQKDPAQVMKFAVIQLERPMKVNEIADKYNVTEEEIRAHNSLGKDDLIPAGRWLIIPVKS